MSVFRPLFWDLFVPFSFFPPSLLKGSVPTGGTQSKEAKGGKNPSKGGRYQDWRITCMGEKKEEEELLREEKTPILPVPTYE